jgi:membrane protein DedA with SNARE-associated domain
MVTNGIVSLPSSQFVYVTAGFFAPTTDLSVLFIATAGTIGNVIGNVILYEVSRSKGLVYVTGWRGFSEEKIIKLRVAFDCRGPIIIFIGKFLPGVKVVVPVVAGIAEMNRVLYFSIITTTSFLWALGLTYFGFYFGKNYGNGTFGWYSAILIILAGGAIYVFCKYVASIQPK